VDVEAWVAREGAEPPHHGLGRSLKVGKEEIVGLVAALEEFVGRDHEDEAAGLAQWLESLLPIFSQWPARLATDVHFYPRLVVDGLVVTPGFVDVHSHTDWIAPLPDGRQLLSPNVSQGITTSVSGNCGISPAPLGDAARPGVLERMLLVGLVSHRLGWSWRSV